MTSPTYKTTSFYPSFALNCVLILMIQCCFNHIAFTQQGRPFITNFPPISYSSNEYATSPQNWGIITDIDGKIIVANTSGVLVFDGTDWALVPDTEDKKLWKFAADENGQIYTAGENEIGYLKANDDGLYEFHSLLDKLNPEHQNFGRITNVVSYQGDVYFKSSHQLFRYSKGRFKIWTSKAKYIKLVSSSAGVFVSKKTDWFRIVDDSLKSIAQDESLPNWRAVFPGPGDTLLIASRSNGLYYLIEKEIIPIENKTANVGIRNGCHIGENEYALATVNDGVIIIDEKGAIVNVIDESKGLSGNSTYFPYFLNNNLWVAMNSGVSMIEYPFKTTVLDKQSGLIGTPLSITNYQNQLIIGTYENIYQLASGQEKLRPFNAELKENFSLIRVEGKMLVSDSKGILIIKKNGAQYRVSSESESNSLLQSRILNDVVFAAYPGTISLIKINESSSELLTSPIEISHSIYSMAEQSDGNLWAAHDGISYIDFSKGLEKPKVTTLDSLNGITSEMGIIEVVSINGNILFGTEIGVYSFNHKTQQLIPYKGFGKRFCDGSETAYNLTEVRNGDVWITTHSNTGILRKQNDNSFIYDSLPIIRMPLSGVWDIYEDDDNIVWVCGTEAIVRYDPKVDFDYSTPYKAFIRSVIINDKDEIFAGNYSDKKGLPTSKQPESYIPTLEYERNTITFKFGAAYYATDVELEYSVMLVGHDKAWSSWRTTGEMNYNNLPEGRYTFKVRSKNIYGNISEEAAYTFEIIPPWYRTTWAYLCFLLGGIVLLYVIVKLNSRRLQRENVKLEGVITERTAEVRQQKERAEQSEAFKQQFLANMSHEIRTPMNAVMGMTNLMLDTPLKPKQKDYMVGIKKSSDNLLHIINDILDLSKIEAGKMELEEIDFSLSDCVDLVKKTLHHRAAERGLELLVSIKSDVSDIVLGDPVRLSQILINLAGNAIKFTEKGSVAIQVTQAAKGVQFAIVDTGIGIPEEKLKTVFESFTQANASDTRKYGGTGLGLSISRQLVETMGGKISVESKVGFGTTFSFVVDLKAGSEERLQQRAALDKDIDGSILDGLTILLADDNEFNRIVARDTLKGRAKVKIIEAEHGQEAIDLLLEHDVNIVLMDVQMPVMNGFEATSRIRKLDHATKKNVPIVALTASVLRTDLDKCKQAGMNSYIPKPFKTDDLISGIAEVLGIKLRTIDTVSKEEQTQSETLTNLDFLADFCEGDRVKMKKYVDMFLKMADSLDDQIKTAVESKNALDLADQVHGLITKFIMMGMEESKSLSIAIENKLRDGGTVADAREDVEVLMTQLKMGMKELDGFRP